MTEELDSAAESAPPQAGLSTNAIFAILGGVALLAIVLGALFYSQPVPDVKAGQAAKIGFAAARIGIACASTREKFDAMIAAALAQDYEKFREATSDGVILRQNDRVKVLERFGDHKENAKLLVITGSYAGRTCYTETDARGFLE
jgi:type IV secretory pathway TrbF-like protein